MDKNSKEILEELRGELRVEFGVRIEAVEQQYDTLAKAYIEIIKDVDHNLGGCITSLHGLFLAEIRDGAKFEHKEMWLKTFAKAEIYTKIIQTKYFDSIHIRNFKEEEAKRKEKT